MSQQLLASVFSGESLLLRCPVYGCDITVGTPPQEITIELDTGGGYTWVVAANSSYCWLGGGCNGPRAFNASASSTFKSTSSPFDEKDTDWEIAHGDFASDTLTLNGSTIQDMQFGIDYSIEGVNILGLGYSLNASYTSLLQALGETGQINSVAYSLWVDDSSGQTGTLLIGGVNTAKYIGDLYTMPIPAVDGVHYLPTVLVTDVVVQGNSSNSSAASGLPAYMTLDSIVPGIYLPDAVALRIYEDTNIPWDATSQQAITQNCNSNQNITFTFTSFNMTIPVSALLHENDDGGCYLTSFPSASGTSILGSSFLRWAYVVYHLSNNEISMAPTNFTSSGADNILEIGNGTAAISGTVTVSVTATATVPTTALIPLLDSVTYSTASKTTQTSSASAMATKNAAPDHSNNSDKLFTSLIGVAFLFAI